MLHTSPIPFDPQALAEAMHAATAHWHLSKEQLEEVASLPSLTLRLHRANFDLWHEEDEARSPHAPDATIVRTKRAIDSLNQTRNNLAEAIDVLLLDSLAAINLPKKDKPLSSETLGSMLDRLSILSLKRFHTAEQVERTDVDEQHRESNRSRLKDLDEQFTDLASCAAELWRDVLNESRRFRLYRQHKMYNDPTLNPVLYRSRA